MSWACAAAERTVREKVPARASLNAVTATCAGGAPDQGVVTEISSKKKDGQAVPAPNVAPSSIFSMPPGKLSWVTSAAPPSKLQVAVPDAVTVNTSWWKLPSEAAGAVASAATPLMWKVIRPVALFQMAEATTAGDASRIDTDPLPSWVFSPGRAAMEADTVTDGLLNDKLLTVFTEAVAPVLDI